MAITEQNLDEHVRLFEAEQRIAELEAAINRQQLWIDLLKHAPHEVQQSIREHTRLDGTDGRQIRVHPAYWSGYDAAWREWKRRYESVINDHRESRQHLVRQLTALGTAEQRIAELEAVVEACDQKMKHAAARMEPLIARLQDKLTRLRTPCRCNPPGSGEACNGCCRVRQALQRLTQGSLGFGNLDVLELFDQAVEEITKGACDESGHHG